MLVLEHHLDERLAHSAHLALGEWPHPVVRCATRQGVRDRRRRQQVRPPCEQELSWASVDVYTLLDREKQVGSSLHLVDHNGRLQVGCEPCRVALGGGPARAVVVRQDARRMLMRGDLLRERALANLARSEQDDDSRVGKRLYDMAAYVAVDELEVHMCTLSLRLIVGTSICASTA